MDRVVTNDDNDDHALLAAMAVKVARLEQEVDRLENRFVLIQRYIHVERSVIGIVGLVLTLLAAFAMNKLLGVH
jgi:predicted Co/Zn/Cd cation transporter (cation efflux family)